MEATRTRPDESNDHTNIVLAGGLEVAALVAFGERNSAACVPARRLCSARGCRLCQYVLVVGALIGNNSLDPVDDNGS